MANVRNHNKQLKKQCLFVQFNALFYKTLHVYFISKTYIGGVATIHVAFYHLSNQPHTHSLWDPSSIEYFITVTHQHSSRASNKNVKHHISTPSANLFKMNRVHTTLVEYTSTILVVSELSYEAA